MTARPPFSSLLQYVATAIALSRIAVVLAAFLFLAVQRGTDAPWLNLCFVAAFGITGAVLVRGRSRDERAGWIGVAFLATATTFGDLIGSRVGANPTQAGMWNWARGLGLLFMVRVDALLPYFIWRFVADFPRLAPGSTSSVQLLRWQRISLVIGLGLIVANVAWFGALTTAPSLAAWLAPLSRFYDDGLGIWFWLLVFSATLPALHEVIRRNRRAPEEERRRTKLLAWTFVGGLSPTVFNLIGDVVPAFREAVPLSFAGWVIYPSLLAIPVVAAWAILIRRALEPSLVLRQAVQYAFARSSILIGVTVPLLMATVLATSTDGVWRAVTDPRIAWLIAGGALAIAVTSHRAGILDWIDRRFFRDQYDARHILAGLVDRCRWAGSRGELDAMLRAELNRALHPDLVDILFLDAAAGRFRGEQLRPIGQASRLVATVSRADEPIRVNLEGSEGRVASLPDEDRLWLADGGVRLLMPLRDAADQTVALVALGERRSELPYSDEDLTLLASVASAAEMAIGYHRLHAVVQPPSAAIDDEPAYECERCGVVGSGFSVCCDTPTQRAALPEVVGGKFRIEQRIGRGGMGVVYRATDLALGRQVAVKTLPFTSPDHVIRMRREARAMALVSHPHLAQIYGAESWHGRPMLVVELFPAGTLADRLARGPLVGAELHALALALASALDAVHRAGILHRDVKPTNIAISEDGVYKLLDFGLARLAPGIRMAGTGSPDALTGKNEPAVGLTADGSVLGTPRYMPAAALRGAAPDPSFDVWSACVVLYEAAAGVHPFAAVGVADLPAAVAAGAPDPPPMVTADLRALLRDALAPHHAITIRTARDLVDRIRSIDR